MAPDRNIDRWISRKTVSYNYMDRGEPWTKLKELHTAMLRHGSSELDRFWFVSGKHKSMCTYIPEDAEEIYDFIQGIYSADLINENWTANYFEFDNQPLVTISVGNGWQDIFMLPVGRIFAAEITRKAEAQTGLPFILALEHLDTSDHFHGYVVGTLKKQGMTETLERIEVTLQKLDDKIECFVPSLEYLDDRLQGCLNGIDSVYELGDRSIHTMEQVFFKTLLELRAVSKYLKVIPMFSEEF